jgi:RNA polymerase sigma factor (sigma-70 family)
MDYIDTILQHYDAMLRYAGKLYSDEQEAEDAVQDLYCKLARPKTIEHYSQKGKEELRNIMYMAIRHAFYDYLRTKKIQKVDLGNCKPMSTGEDTDRALIEKESIRRLYSINNIKLKRVCFFMLKGYDYEEIARRMKTTQGNVRGLVFRLRNEALITKIANDG